MPIRLQLSLFAETFAVCRLGAEEPIPSALLKADLVSITRTADELSIVCAADAAPAHAQCEKGWRALKVHGPLPFSMTGVLASLAVPLAEAGIPIFAISTFETDYVLVPEGRTSAAVAALRDAGHEVEDDGPASAGRRNSVRTE